LNYKLFGEGEDVPHFFYDGPHVIGKVPRLRSGRLRAHGGAGVVSEYDGNNNLLRKYIYGPGICVAFTPGFNRICSKFRFKAGMC
jgi:hypothetical protein